MRDRRASIWTQLRAGSFAALDYLFTDARKKTEICMHTGDVANDSPAAMAQVLAMVMATSPGADIGEIRMLEQLDAFKRIGVSESTFLRISRECQSGVCQGLSRHEYLYPDDLEVIDEILDRVHDAGHRLLLCRLAGCLITADGRVQDVERTVYDRMLLRWGYTRASLAQAILTERVH